MSDVCVYIYTHTPSHTIFNSLISWVTPLVIKHGNGKSPIDGSLNSKIINKCGIFNCLPCLIPSSPKISIIPRVGRFGRFAPAQRRTGRNAQFYLLWAILWHQHLRNVVYSTPGHSTTCNRLLNRKGKTALHITRIEYWLNRQSQNWSQSKCTGNSYI